MNMIEGQIEKIKKGGRMGIMTHLVIGYPTLNHTMRLAMEMERAGVDMIELQIPFSEPLADGPVIMKACEESLRNGTKVDDAFRIAKKLSSRLGIPLLFMAYYNNVFKYGTERFCKDAKEAGVSGLIVPDIPIEEEDNEKFIRHCNANDLYSIRVVSPVSTEERLSKNANVGRGFLYCTSVQGITGVRKNMDPKIAGYLKRARSKTEMPIAVGFGISKREHLKVLSKYAEIAVIGSAIIKIMDESRSKEMVKNVGYFIKDIRKF